MIQLPTSGEPGYIRFPTLIRGGMTAFRDPIRAAALGAAASYPAALPTLSALAPLSRSGKQPWRGAERLAVDLVTLPTHGHVRAEERRELFELLRNG